MEGVLLKVYNYCWDSSIWFPEGMKWSDLESKDPNIYFGKPKDIHWCVVVGMILLVVRFVCEIVLLRPMGRYFKIKESKPQLSPNESLEVAFNQYKGRLPEIEIEKISKQTDMRELDVIKWLSIRRNQNNPTSMFKFCEVCWHFILYVSLFIFGIVVMKNKPWLWNSQHFWKDWPQPTDNDIYWYYLIEMGAYWSFLFTIFIDTKRKDFYEMTIHHFATLTLLYLSWCASFTRVGSYILLLHDAADGWLASAKITNYCKYTKLCEFCFAMFALVWIVTRLGIYPYVPLYSVIVEIHEHIGHFPIHKIFVVLLVLLQLLHIMWTYYLLKVIVQKCQTGEVKKDARSDSDDTDSSDTEQPINGVPVHNSKNKGDAQLTRKSN
ncbi:hypothetical protein LOTGIDRAFT_219624 [Lottia gigantea]|uniref:TLC domain-containing protein n=1 Tax=Lottia gigantea TaxID=225164 RepID=V3ZUF8_LOTGI|nr:hypothetical protein LOTGIDRAFT_219624 [Lottia gigantea]ESO87992.1 hypothetical protein LOTGIDRAFT_219624 [Lottia gigantea]